MTDQEKFVELMRSFGLEPEVMEGPVRARYEREQLGVAVIMFCGRGPLAELDLGMDYPPVFGFDANGKFVICGSVV